MPNKKNPVSRQTPTIHLNGDQLHVHIPMSFKKKGGRKEIILPEGCSLPDAPVNTPVQKPLVVALALGHRWLELLMDGEFPSVNDLAEAVEIDPSLLRRHLGLTCLPPKLVLEILNGQEPEGMSLEKLKDVPVRWAISANHFGLVLRSV